MKNTTLILLTIVFSTSCKNRQQENKQTTQTIDSLQRDSSLDKTNKIFINPFRDINNFDLKVGNDFIDSIHAEYLRTVKHTIDNDICLGDNCESYQTFINNENNEILYFFKGDGGEYGFSNDQYLLRNDSLCFVRNFNVDIEVWPTDSSGTVWKVEEMTYKFDNQKVTGTRKTILTKDLYEFDFTLKTIKSETITVTYRDAFMEKTRELKRLLELKNSKDRD